LEKIFRNDCGKYYVARQCIMIIYCVHDYADETDEGSYVTVREKVIKTMQAEIK